MFHADDEVFDEFDVVTGTEWDNEDLSYDAQGFVHEFTYSIVDEFADEVAATYTPYFDV